MTIYILHIQYSLFENMDDKMEELRALLHEAFTPLDLFGIHGFPNGFYKRVLIIVLEFFGNVEDLIIHRIVSFCKLMVLSPFTHLGGTWQKSSSHLVCPWGQVSSQGCNLVLDSSV